MKSGNSHSLLMLTAVLGLALTTTSACAQNRTSVNQDTGAKTQAEVSPAGGEQSGPVIVVDKQFHQREIKVRKGGLFVVELEQLGSAGYEWAVSELDEASFEIVQVDTLDEPQPGDVTGAPVTRQWRVRVKKEGNPTIRFLHRRPWEGPEEASDRFELKVRILP